MRHSIRLLLIAFIAISSFTFLQQDSAHAGGFGGSFFDAVSFECPNVINFSGQWEVSDGEDAYVRVYDPATGTVLDDQYFSDLVGVGTNYFSGSFSLTEPLPDSVIIELWQGWAPRLTEATVEKSFGLAEIYNPSTANLSGTDVNPLPPDGEWYFEDSQLITIPECTSVDGCDSAFTIYGMALILDQQLGYSAPNGEPARDMQGNLIWVLHDVDQDGQDTYLIIDIQTGADGETWLGIFIGACDPVYVPLNKAYPLNAIPVD